MKTTSWKMDKRSRRAKREVPRQEFDTEVDGHRVILIGHGLKGEPVYQCLDCDDEHRAS